MHTRTHIMHFYYIHVCNNENDYCYVVSKQHVIVIKTVNSCSEAHTSHDHACIQFDVDSSYAY